MKYQIVTKRGKALTGEIYDLESARLALSMYNAERDSIKRVNVIRQTRWSKGYNAARDKDEREAWLANKPVKERVPAEALLVGCMA